MSAIQHNPNINVERIIAKIDNDFNPDNSDWIPRVGAWCIDAMSQINVLKTKKKRIKVSVKDKIAYSNCPLDENNIKVFDKNGCEIKKADDYTNCNNCSFTGEETNDINNIEYTNTSDIINNSNASNDDNVIAETINDKYPYRYNILHYNKNINKENRNYVVIGCNKLELNFSTDYIYIEGEYVETQFSKLYNCEVPVIPNNGTLIEYIVYYCMYKMLCRGYKHPVLNLNASQYGTNPYYIAMQLKEEAKRSVLNNNINTDDVDNIWRSNFIINTFDPRR